MRLKDKVVIITGGAGGIATGMALAMAKEGAILALVDVNEEAGKIVEAKVQQFSPKSTFLVGNLFDVENLPNIIESVVKKYGKLDVLVNNAHASKQKPFEEITQEDFDLSFGTGFYPTFYLMKAALPYLKETQGSVINFASGAGLNGQPTQTAYAAAKEAIRAISRVAANEWGKFNINVNLISPIAKSPAVEKWAEAFPEMYEASLTSIPLGRWGEPEEDIGRVAVFLASDDARYITGQTFMVDGGSIQLR
ncbi:MAG: SDR family oxidoreductase [Solibacillus sp.]|jgi:NAD(P)-dependent dehydrogenase (short-subunit alcohol dehydrogenase family)|uniref:SDR family NAD(P)-dependent oxidoreductase n=1 Tax=unclassified Solibacillus TaxID=2637870 RepID=UPI0030FD1E4A